MSIGMSMECRWDFEGLMGRPYVDGMSTGMSMGCRCADGLMGCRNVDGMSMGMSMGCRYDVDRTTMGCR